MFPKLSKYIFLLLVVRCFAQNDVGSGDIEIKSRSWLGQDLCYEVTCLNNGYCQNGQCVCVTGFTGSRCEQESRINIPPYNQCSYGTCPQDAKCEPLQIQNGIGWKCVQMYRNVCESMPCLNGGTCSRVNFANGINSETFQCQCPPGYSGRTCEIPPTQRPPIPSSVCSTNPCQNGCQCTPSCRHSKGYYCKGTSGFLGKNCDIPSPVLTCAPGFVQLRIDPAFVAQYDRGVPNGYLQASSGMNNLGSNDPSCMATSSSFNIPLHSGICGITKTVTADGVTYQGTVWYNRRINNGGFDMPIPVIQFFCRYTTEYDIITSLQPAVDKPVNIVDYGKSVQQGTIDLCKVEYSCPNPCPTQFRVTGGAIYTVGEMIHLNIRSGSTGSNQNEHSAVESLYVSCASSQNANPEVVLIQSGCPATSLPNYMPTKVTHNALTDCVCVSFQVPRLSSCNIVYIHAKLTNCFGKITSACPGGSQHCANRYRRAARYNDSIVDIFGPIYFVDEAPGKGELILFPNKTIVAMDTPLLEELEDIEIPQTKPSAELWIMGTLAVIFLVFSALSISYAVFKLLSNRLKV